MLKVWRWYKMCLDVHPIKTQMISSGVLWGAGDITAQYITHSTSLLDSKRGFNVDWKRGAMTSIFGLGFVGPVGHFWYEGLDKLIKVKFRMEPQTRGFVATKVAADVIIFGPLDLFVFFSYMGFACGKSMGEVKEDVKRDFLPALILEGGAWPLLQAINFRYVPVRYQLLYVNVFCLLDTAFLLWLDHQKDAPWKKWFTYSPLPPMKEDDSEGG